MAPTSKPKINMLHRSVFLLLPLFFVLHSLPVYSEDNLPNPPRTDDQLEEELKYLKAETYVITASRIPEDIKKTATSITIVTDKQIRQMGARNISDVLQTSSGLWLLLLLFRDSCLICPRHARQRFNQASVHGQQSSPE